MAQSSNAVDAGHVGMELPGDIVERIVACLPTLSIIHLRGACKLWSGHASDRDFLLAHHLRQPTLPLLYSECNVSEDDEDATSHEYYCLETVDLRAVLPRRMVVRFKEEKFPTFPFFNPLTVHGSCDGLLLLEYLEDHLFVCNPATRWWARLPPLPRFQFCISGFYAHAASGEYRVLFLRKDDDIQWNYCVLTVGSQQPERIVAQRLPSRSLAEAHAVGAGAEYSETMAPVPAPAPVLLHGSLHWPLHPLQVEMLVFDTVAESFRWMRPPRDISKYIRCFLFRTKEGKLAMSNWNQNHSTAELWIMQDYENKTWALSFSIQVPFDNSVDEGMPQDVIIVSEDGDMLVDFQDKVLHYAKNGSLLQTLSCDGPGIYFARHFLQESLVQHPCLDRQQDDDDFDGPPFFKEI